MKKLLFALVAVSLLAAGCSKGQTQVKNGQYEKNNQQSTAANGSGELSNWKIYKNDKYGLEIKYPNDWQVKEQSDKLAGFCPTQGGMPCKPDIDGFAANIQLIILENPKKLELGNFLTSTKNINKYSQFLKEENIDGHKALLYGPQDIVQAFAFIADEDKVVSLQALTHKEVFDKMLATFSFAQKDIKPMEYANSSQSGQIEFSYKIRNFVESEKNGQRKVTTPIALYVGDTQVAQFDFIGLAGKVKYMDSDKDMVYFSVEPDGLGGYYIYNPFFNLYKLDLKTKAVSEVSLAKGDRMLSGLRITDDLKSVIYSSDKVYIQDLATGSKKSYNLPPKTSDQNNQIGNIVLSPDKSKLAIAESYGPDNEYGEIYILNLSTGKYALYKKDAAHHLQVEGWKDNNEVDWKVIQ